NFSKDGKGKDKGQGIDTDDFPAENVPGDDAQDFIKKLNALPAESERRGGNPLPPEGEWEKAPRPGTKTRSHCGDSLTGKSANFASGLGRTARVGSYKANAWGLYDMHGNVWEWCADWHGSYEDKKQTDPKGPATGSRRSIRGGSWDSQNRYCRSSQRGSNTVTH